MQKLALIFLLFYSVLITTLFFHSMTEGSNKKIMLEDGEELLSMPERDDLSKIESGMQKLDYPNREKIKAQDDKSVLNESEAEEVDMLEDTGPPVIPEEIQKKEEKYHDDNSEKMLAYFEQSVGIDLTQEQEQKALSAFRAMGESDKTAIVDADTAFLDRKLNLSQQQKDKVRKAISEFNYEPEGEGEEISDSDIGQIENQNQVFFNQVAPLLDEKQKSDLMQMMQDGTTFADE